MYGRYRRSWSPSDDPKVYNNNPTIPARIAAVLAQSTITTKNFEVVQSFQKTWNRYWQLTDKQYNYFESIEKSFSSASIAQKKASDKRKETWIKNFSSDPDRVLRFKLSVQYYSVTAYFADPIKAAKSDPDFIPSEALYNKMCCNDYMNKVYNSYKAPAKFAVGDMVIMLSSYSSSRPATLNTLNLFTERHVTNVRDDAICIIAAVNSHAPVSSAIRGAKMYTVVPIAWSNEKGYGSKEKKPCYVMERHIRKHK